MAYSRRCKRGENCWTGAITGPISGMFEEGIGGVPPSQVVLTLGDWEATGVNAPKSQTSFV